MRSRLDALGKKLDNLATCYDNMISTLNQMKQASKTFSTYTT